MKANELRIGNLVKLKDIITTYQEVIMIDGEVNVIQCKNDIHSPLEDYEPIPLTEEILLKCGFKWSIYHQAHSNDSDSFDYVIDICKEFCRVIKYRRNGDVLIHIKYLHQLQNLYWCLCGEELEINL